MRPHWEDRHRFVRRSEYEVCEGCEACAGYVARRE